MQVSEMVLSGLCLGVSDWIDYETKKVLGSQIDLGYKKTTGKFALQSIKIENQSLSALENYADSLISLKLTDVSISCYMQGNRPSLSIKAKSVQIDEQIEI